MIKRIFGLTMRDLPADATVDHLDRSGKTADIGAFMGLTQG